MASLIETNSATLTVRTNILGPRPEVLALNSGHFYPDSNTRDWWRYSGVNGARVFISPSNIEPSDDISPVGDGVTDSASFLTRKAAIRTNQLNSSYINWPVFENRYENATLSGNNRIRVNYAMGALRALNIDICAQITASQSRLPIASSTDWPNMWELWQHYYAQAFYLARNFDVTRYQMYNEPNHPNADGLTESDFLLRLQLASDAVQCAIEDVNKLYGKQLQAKMLAPVTAGNATSGWPGWGEMVVTNRHVNFLGQTDPAFSLIHVYDYHQYGSSPSAFGSGLLNLNAYLTLAMLPEGRYPTSISEFNTRTGASYDAIPDTLDYPAEYSRLGAICVNLAANNCSEMYCFKFSQTESSNPNYPVQKNALHYVDNDLAPYNIGGITKAGEVWRLFTKSLPQTGIRLGVSKGTGVADLDVQGSAAGPLYRLYSANNTASAVDLGVNLSAWSIPTNNLVMVEEVSEACSGAIRTMTNSGSSQILTGTQPSNSVWLLTASSEKQAPEQVLIASTDAEVRDGANKNANFGKAATMMVRNDPASTANRSVAFLKFQLPATNDMTRLQFAVFTFAAQSGGDGTAQAHVYALASNNWSETTLTWNNAPNLRDNVPAGNLIQNGVVEGGGVSAFIMGQLLTTSTNAADLSVDVTEYFRGRTNLEASFLIAQDPRWNVTLPSLETGDTQPAGIRITSKDPTSSTLSAPRLRLIFTAPRNPPVAAGDSYSSLQNTILKVPAPGLLANDSAGSEPSFVSNVTTAPTNGTVALGPDGSFIYTPAPNFRGSDAFAYVAADSATSSAPALVSISVAPAFPVWTNRPAVAEAFVRGGAYAETNPDEIGTNFLMVKYYTNGSLDLSRKTFLKFDLSGLNLHASAGARLGLRFTAPFKQAVQLWGLEQSWPEFSSDITWNSAQANDTASNDMLGSGGFQAARIGQSLLAPATDSDLFEFVIPNLATVIPDAQPVFALTGVHHPENNSGGLRIQLHSATLFALANFAVPDTAAAPAFLDFEYGTNGLLNLVLNGSPGTPYVVESATNLIQPAWEALATNVANANGTWSVSDTQRSNSLVRFYRAYLPRY